MFRCAVMLLFWIFCLTVSADQKLSEETTREALLTSITQRRESAWLIAQQIWKDAEPGYQEYESSKLLADQLEAAGFTVKRAVADIPTAFTAEYGSGQPIIGI